MTGSEYKEITKFAIEHGHTKLSDEQKEFLKQCVDQATNVDDLVGLLLIALKT